MSKSNSYWVADVNTDETLVAKSILKWLDRRLEKELDQTYATIYADARAVHGKKMTTFYARENGKGLLKFRADHEMEVSGTGDDAYGHNRLHEVVRRVIIPLIENGGINISLANELKFQCRGTFNDLYSEIERALRS